MLLGAEAVVSAADGGAAPRVWLAYSLCTNFGHRTLHVYALLSLQCKITASSFVCTSDSPFVRRDS
jgi:hypothetical protein